MHTQAFISLGSNLGNKKQNIKEAFKRLNQHEKIKVIKKSSLHETKPVGYLDQPDFVNAVCQIETALEPRELLDIVKQIEQDMGREKTFKWGPRIIDLDILLYGNKIIKEHDLEIPHPRMHERKFVLEPMAEISSKNCEKKS